MTLFEYVLLFTCFAAAALAVDVEFESPCPNQFEYDVTDQHHQWSGTLKLLSEDELHGLWIRVKFDAPVKEVILEKKFGGETVSRSPNNDEFLIKNPSFSLKANLKTDIKLTVRYEGENIARLVSYRLNARTVCPERSGDATEVFANDINAKDFLTQVQQPYHNIKLPTFECGQNKNADSAPWHAALLLNQGDKHLRFLCEATLITPQHVLTAAHCVHYLERLAVTQIKVAFSKSDLKPEAKSKIEAEVGRIIVHPGYNLANLVNDIAILELKKPVIADPSIQPICLPSSQAQPGKKTLLTGYTINGKLNVESQLQSVRVEEISSVECERRSKQFGPLIGDNVYCATYTKGTSSCVGDSGSGLASLRTEDDRWELKGIVTVGIALQGKTECSPTSTVLLADISKHVRWIQTATL